MDDTTTKAQDPSERPASDGPLPVRVKRDGHIRGNRDGQRPQLTDLPALAALRLTEEDLAELRNQGFVNQEVRGCHTFYKLRFRRARRQVVRYIADAEQAAAIRAELARLQADHRLQRELGRLTKRAGRLLRASKESLEPIVAAAGWKFHGQALRRPRTPKTSP